MKHLIFHRRNTMIDDGMRDSYDMYLEEHIDGVNKSFNWLYEKLPEIFDGYDADYIGSIVANHDKSKYDDEEYFAYCEYFYGNEKDSKEVLEDFDYAWLHHQHNNPHHWQYWLLREDDGHNKALEMPYEYIVEMICDWWSFSWKKGDLFEIFNWFDNNTEKILLHENSRKTVDDIMSKIKTKLEELDGNKE